MQDTQLHACHERWAQGVVEILLGYELLGVCVLERTHRRAALEVEACLEGLDGGIHLAAGAVVSRVYVGHGAAVGYDVALEVPSVAQYVLHEERAGRTAVAVDGVVGRHDGLDLCVLDQHLECRKVCLIEILERRFDIGSVSCGLRARMHGEVLGAGCGLEIVRVVALKPLDECRSQHARQIGVLAVGLHAAAPARITEDVDVGRPEGKSGVAAVVAYALRHLILCARLVRDGVAYAVEQFDVECGAKAYRLREYRCAAAAAHAVQTLVPPVVGFDAEALDARCRVHHLADLLVDVHRVEQLIDLLFHRLLRLLRGLRLCAAAAGKHRRST